MFRNFFSIIILLLLISATILPAQNLNPMEQLGKNIFFDKISSPDRQACASCHAPEVGFTGPIPGINLISAVYPGAVPTRAGNRKPPSAAYATLSPIFHFDEEEGLFVGGNFWDGRATGEHLDNPAADQALGPFLNPVEQNNASKKDVLMQIADAKYADLWRDVWGEPIRYDTQVEIDNNYDRIGLAIAAYEGSVEVNQFTSKYDYYLDGETELTEQEAWGLDLFEGKAQCSACHLSDPDEQNPPLFTDFTYDNLGTPKNPDNPVYESDPNYIDPGLGGFLATRAEWADMVGENMGKHKVPTLRNVAKAPSKKFIKAYLHNGVFKSLEEVVHFYNTRDVESWPPPEVPENVNTDELGDLGLTMAEEEAIVAFMETLSDGYDLKNDKVKVNVHTNLKVTGANPFNPTTQLTYSLTEDSHIQINVYNTIGQKVTTLVNTYKSAGTYQVNFNAGNLASGIYYIRLYTKNGIQTQKVSLVK